MKTLWVVLEKEINEQLRTYRVLVVGAVLIVFGLLSPVIAKFTPELIRQLADTQETAALVQIMPQPTLLEAVAQFVKTISQFGLLLAILATMGAVVQEKEKGTAAMMLVKPLPRGTFLLTKFLSIAGLFFVTLALSGLACAYYTTLLFGPIDPGAWAALLGLMYLYLLTYISLTLFCSVITKSIVASGGLALGGMLFIEILGALPRIGNYFPDQLLGWGVGITGGDPTTHWPALILSLVLIILALVASWRIFNRQEI